MSLVKKVGTVGGGILISRILGFIRDIIIAYKLGAGILSDAFFVAFKIPNLFRRLFAEGAFSAAFVPIFAGKLIAGRKEAISFADNVLSILMMILLVITLFMQVFMPQFLTVIAPGFYY
jgi:putative peptidoglycan lipid II flippase